MNNNTAIDVIIPLFNGDNFVLKALQSVNAQTLPPQRIIVIDDGSTDSSSNTVQDYAQSSKVPVTYIKKDNGGPSSARNSGIKASTARFVAFLDHDDVWLPDKLQKQIDIFYHTDYPRLGLVYCDYSHIDGKSLHLQYKKHRSPGLRGQVFEQLLAGNLICGSASAALIRRSCLDDVGVFDENLRGGEDWDMWLRIAMAGYEVDFSPDNLLKIRSHDNNAQKDAKNMFLNELMLYSKWIGLLSNRNQTELVPTKWSFRILRKMINRLPRLDFIHMAVTTLSAEAKRVLINNRNTQAPRIQP